MEAFIAQVKEIYDATDDVGKGGILDQLHELQLELETPFATAQRIASLHLQTAVIRVGFDVGLFEYLDNDVPRSIQELADRVKAAPALLRRIFRYLASFHVIRQVDDDRFTSTKLSNALAKPDFRPQICHYFDNVASTWQELPKFLAETNYQDISNPINTPFQKANNTDLFCPAYFTRFPDIIENFNQYMAFQRGELPDWLSVFPIDQSDPPNGVSHEPVLFVDLGGGLGHQCVSLKSKYPHSSGRIILQDLPQVIEEATPVRSQGVELMVHDVFQIQPVKGIRSPRLTKSLS